MSSVAISRLLPRNKYASNALLIYDASHPEFMASLYQAQKG